MDSARSSAQAICASDVATSAELSALDHMTAKAWLMSCGDNPAEANRASDEGASTPDERQRNLARLNLSEFAGSLELSLLLHAAAI
eukprot:1278653-Pleurochrysis_carterae.AAC.1